MICVKMLHSRMSTDMKLWTGNRGWMWSEQMYINNFNAFVHFYADDTIIYCAQNIKMVFKELQLAFDFIQSQLCQLRLILIAEKNQDHVVLK